MAFNPIHAFNNQIHNFFRSAFEYNVPEIHKFLNDVVAHPDHYRERDPAHPTQPYPDPNAQQRRNDLRLLRDEIVALTPPDGAKYTTPAPKQSILRTAHDLAPTGTIPWPGVNNIQERFIAIFDLLGTFLSIIGPAPTTGTAPTAKNYYLPLVVVYAKWCTTLATGGGGLIPNKAQVTWARQNANHPTQFFFLGANARGWPKKNRSATDWRLLVKQRRHTYMSRSVEVQYQVWGHSPSITLNGPESGWNFGNCAESYPFLYLLADGMAANTISGISLIVPSIKEHTVNWAQYWTEDNLEPPCENCEYQIRRYHAVLANFTPWQHA